MKKYSITLLLIFLLFSFILSSCKINEDNNIEPKPAVKPEPKVKPNPVAVDPEIPTAKSGSKIEQESVAKPDSTTVKPRSAVKPESEIEEPRSIVESKPAIESESIIEPRSLAKIEINASRGLIKPYVGKKAFNSGFKLIMELNNDNSVLISELNIKTGKTTSIFLAQSIEDIRNIAIEDTTVLLDKNDKNKKIKTEKYKNNTYVRLYGPKVSELKEYFAYSVSISEFNKELGKFN